jgi:nitrite reductase/ring-hydroxylating ferredoxin subunit
MTRHIVARTADIPPGGNKVVGVDGRDIVVFHHANGEFFALLNRCPHEGAPLDKAVCIARLTSDEPGVYQRSRIGEMLRCPWHGWEFDMRNGQSYFDPARVKIRTYPVVVEDGETLAKGPFVAETFQVYVEDSYVVVEINK